MNKLKKMPWGELIVPLIAIVYAVYSVGMQINAGYHTNTIKYSLYLSIPIVVFAIIVILQVVKKGMVTSEEMADEVKSKGDVKRVLLTIGWTLLFVASLGILGYLLGFFLYLAAYLWYMGIRSKPKHLAISISVVLLVHFVFVKWIGLPLPKGILMGIL